MVAVTIAHTGICNRLPAGFLFVLPSSYERPALPIACDETATSQPGIMCEDSMRLFLYSLRPGHRFRTRCVWNNAGRVFCNSATPL
jgi:hypothetical protein